MPYKRQTKKKIDEVSFNSYVIININTLLTAGILDLLKFYKAQCGRIEFT